nr:hypothetical protein [Tanacetum cinerariifolium]
ARVPDARGKAYVLGGGDANSDSNTVMNVSYAIKLADGRTSKTNAVLRGCTLGLLGHPFNIDLMPIDLVVLTSSSAWIEIIVLTLDSLNDNKGVSSEGPSITSIPKEGPSIARRFKEPILKELLEWYRYDTIEDYLPVAKKLIPKVIFKSPIPIKGCVLGLANVETWDKTVKKFRMRIAERCADKSKGKRKNHLVEIQADDHDLLVNSDNKNDDMLGFESKKYSDDEDADGTNHAEDVDATNHSNLKLVKRGITRLYMFRKEYGKPGGIKIKIENKEIEANEEPPRGIMWLKGRVNKDGEFTDDEIRSVGDKLENRGYARGVGSGVTYKKYSYHPQSRQATNERIKLLQTQLDNEIREHQQKDVLVKKFSTEMTKKDVLVKKLSNEITETKGMLSQLMNQLATQGAQLNLSSQLQVASDVTPMGAYEVDETQSSVVVRDKDARIQKKSNGLVTLNSKMEPVKTVRPKKVLKSRRNGSQDSQSQENVSPTQELPTASKCKLWHLKKSNIVALGTVYKSNGKQMLHNQALPNDCYKVSIDSSLVDAACIPDVGNNGLKTFKDGVGGFFAWPKNQVVLDEEITPPTTIQKISDYNSTPKLQSKLKNYVSRKTMQRQARTGKSHKS